LLLAAAGPNYLRNRGVLAEGLGSCRLPTYPQSFQLSARVVILSHGSQASDIESLIRQRVVHGMETGGASFQSFAVRRLPAAFWRGFVSGEPYEGKDGPDRLT